MQTNRHTHTILILLIILSFSCNHQNDRPHLNSAVKVANWLQAASVKMIEGKVWPADPNDSTSISTNLYSGSPGPVLFFLEAYNTTNNQAYLEEAKAGADYLLASLPDSITEPYQAGLYTGIAGVGFVLNETFRISGESKYREGVLQCVQLLHNSVRTVDSGAEWGEVTDIISGNAGIGLFLLYTARELNHTDSKELVSRVGRRLLKSGIEEHHGLKWEMSPQYQRLMPNFSHGTAGISYFLASLYEETGDHNFLDGAIAGAEYLINITNEQGLIFHHEPGGKELYYLGWCHGPVGTARLYYKLWQVTNEAKWIQAMQTAVRGVMFSGIPEQRPPGFWNNVSQCCGSAGVADFFLEMYTITNENDYLEFSNKVTKDLLNRTSPVGEGLKWIQAEHRVKPELLIAQTGYMQGAAGIGLFLLHFDAFEQGKEAVIKLPDSPF